jgi:hypothetical protein
LINLQGNDSINIGKLFPGTFNSAALCITAITSVIIGSVYSATLLPNPMIDTTLVAYRSKWLTYSFGSFNKSNATTLLSSF